MNSLLSHLMDKEGQQFITEAYRQLLNRDVDSAGLQHHLGLLAAGTSKLDIIIGIVLGEEATRLYSGR
jgi:hypothetical protein